MSDADRAYKYTGGSQGDNHSIRRTRLVRQNSDHLLSYYESSIPNEAAHFPRPPSPNKPVSAYHHSRTHSGESSSSAYSNNEADQNDTRDTGSETSTSVTKRLGIPSKGGADRRRLAIVQLDSSTNGPHLNPPSDMPTTPGSIRQRRGYNNLAGLALIAPPDAASHTYTHLTPPSTAPLTGDTMSRALVQDKAHYRSASDIAPTATKISRAWLFQSKRLNDHKGSDTRAPSDPSQFTSPKTADHAHSPYLTLDLAGFGSSIGTPLIGEAKEIHVPVAAPIVMNLENVGQPKTTLPSPRADSPASSTVCGHGQSGNMTGQTTNDENKTSDPRPSRLQSPVPPPTNIDDGEVGQGHQTRSSGVAALRSAKMNEASNDIRDSSVGQSKVFTHRREPATATKEPDNLTFPMDSLSRKPLPNRESNDLTLEEVTPSRPDSVGPISPQYRVLPPTPVSKPPTSESAQKPKDSSPPKLDHTKFDQWLKENPQFSTRDSRRGASVDEPRRYGFDRPTSRLSVDHLTVEPPEPPLKGLRRSLTTKVKRLSSISRTASLSSKSASRSSQDTRNPSRTPSPLANYQTRILPMNSHKVRSLNPAALFCHEIGGQTTSLQRCSIYANKINELSMYDCGLSDWIVQMKDQNLVPQRKRGPSSFVSQPRQTSRSSIISEATFPRRLDATTATDLSPGQFDDVSSPGLPQLPYPSLAVRSIPARSNTSTSSITPPTSLRSLTPSFSTTGFFSALGRKVSLSKRDRTTLSTRISSPGVSPGGARLPTGNVPPMNPRPIQITTPPTIPGGPRAPPSRSKRSQTYMMKLVSETAAREHDHSLDQSTSLNDTHTLDNVIDIKPDPEFTEQVDKLAALIPQADRNVLAGYLRRAGSDMLAIGQYLADERTGVVRSP